MHFMFKWKYLIRNILGFKRDFSFSIFFWLVNFLNSVNFLISYFSAAILMGILSSSMVFIAALITSSGTLFLLVVLSLTRGIWKKWASLKETDHFELHFQIWSQHFNLIKELFSFNFIVFGNSFLVKETKSKPILLKLIRSTLLMHFYY